MPKIHTRANAHTKNDRLQRRALTRNSLQLQMPTPPRSTQNPHLPPENSILTLSPLASYAYITVTLGILFSGVKENPQLLYLASFMAVAPLGPSVLKVFISKIFKK